MRKKGLGYQPLFLWTKWVAHLVRLRYDCAIRAATGFLNELPRCEDMTRLNRYAAIVASIVVGVTLLVSGTGKVPGQTEFTWALLKSFWSPAVAYLIGSVLPWAEIALGVLLVTGTYARIAAGFVLPMTVGFMANNIWALTNGITTFTECSSCFGIWERYLGSLSPTGALVFDIVLLLLALTVLLFYPRRFTYFMPWFITPKATQGASGIANG